MGVRQTRTKRLASTRGLGATASFSALDSALRAVRASDSREEAMASLAKATALLNSYMNPALGLAEPSLGSRSRIPSFESFRAESFLWGQPDQAAWLTDLEKRLQKYFQVVKKVVDDYGPDEYQISLGFPSGVSVALTWKVA